MGNFRPKDVFRRAREAEKLGHQKLASSLYAQLAGYLRGRGKAKEAKNVLERAITLSPDSPRLYLQLALCHSALDKKSAAANATKLFTRHTIRRGKVAEYTPYLETQLKDLPALRVFYYQALLELDRTNAQPFLLLARAERQLGQLDLAQKSLLEALRTKTMDSEVLSALKDVVAARSDDEAGFHLRSFEAGKLLRNDLILLLSGSRSGRSWEGTPEEPTGEKDLNTLIKELEAEIGGTLTESRDSVGPLVREFRQKSAAILAGDSKARIDMALAFFEMGLNEDAREELSPILSTDNLYLEAQSLLGEILFQQGSDLGALEVYQRCLRDERASAEIANEARYKLLQIYLRLGDGKQALQLAVELEKKSPSYRDLRQLKLQAQEVARAQSTSEDPERTGQTSNRVNRVSAAYRKTMAGRKR